MINTNNDRIVLSAYMTWFTTTGTTYKPSGFSKKASLNISLSEIPINSRDSGDWDDFVPGKFSWDGSEDMIYNFVSGGTNSGSTGVDEIYRMFLDKKIIKVQLGIINTTSNAPNWVLDNSKKYWSGNILITNMKLDIDPETNAPVAVNVTFKGKGELTYS